MSDRGITVTFIDRAGHRGEFEVAQIIAIDGTPWIGADDRVILTDRLTYLEGRVDTMERMLLAAQAWEPGEEQEV